MAIIMGIDPSVAHCGLVVFDTADFTLLYQGTIKNPAGAANNYSMAPFDLIRGGVREVAAHYKVEFAYMEKMFPGKIPSIAELLFYASFTVRQALHELDIPVSIIPTIGVRKGWRWFTLGAGYAAFKGVNAKSTNKLRLSDALGVKLVNEHQADAAGVAVAGWYFQTGVDFRDVLGVPKPDFTEPKKDAASKPKSRSKSSPKRGAAGAGV